MTTLAIDCRHLTHRYGQFTAVDDLNLEVGDIAVAVVKSTTVIVETPH